MIKQTVVKDFGVYFDSMIDFGNHNEFMIGGTNRMLGLVTRMSHNFHSKNCMVSLFIYYVWSILEFRSVIWSLWYDVHKNRIEAIQIEFQKYLCFRVQRVAINSNIQVVRIQFRRAEEGLLWFVFCIKTWTIISPDILRDIDFCIPIITRLKKQKHKTINQNV